MLSNSELRASARASLEGHWGTYILLALLTGIIVGLPQPFSFYFSIVEPGNMKGDLLNFVWALIVLPVSWGYNVCFLHRDRNKPAPKIGELFAGFSNYLRIVGTMLLMGLYVLLWSLLLVVPGIIKSFSYALTPFILKDEPGLSYNAAIERSMALMSGNKCRLFLLYLSFIGWGILCLLTLGIGFLLLVPYMDMSFAKFYEDVKADYERKPRGRTFDGTPVPSGEEQTL